MFSLKSRYRRRQGPLATTHPNSRVTRSFQSASGAAHSLATALHAANASAGKKGRTAGSASCGSDGRDDNS